MLKIKQPIATPPWSQLGKKLESLCRKALYECIDSDTTKLGVALSGGKDSLTLLFLLHAIAGKGFPPFQIYAYHIAGTYSCGAALHKNFLHGICDTLSIPLKMIHLEQQEENLNCYSCSRKRRSLIFNAAKKDGIDVIAFGHHQDDSIETLLMNLFHKAEFAANLIRVPMHEYQITIIRPLIYIQETLITEFAKKYGFLRITCQCLIGQDSMRKKTKHLIEQIETIFPNIKQNLALAGMKYGSTKALRP